MLAAPIQSRGAMMNPLSGPLAVAVLVMLGGSSLCLFTGAAADEGRAGARGIILIHDVAELQAMHDDLDGSYALENDIDASATKDWNGGRGFEPLGNDSGTEEYDEFTFETHVSTAFSGTFDGRGHNITGLWMDRAESDLVGLFGLIDGHSRISNLSLISAEINGRAVVGGIVGRCNFSTVTNCHFNGTLKQGGNMGGIVGETNYAIITFCTFNGRMETVGGTNGGIVGELRLSTAANCSSTGTLQSGETAGGIAGSSPGGGIFNCRSDVSLDGDMTAGGIVGSNSGAVSNCYSTGPLLGERNYLGGVAGINGGSIANCSATGPVGGGALYVGGLVGRNEGTITNCSASGKVEASYRDTGGLVGTNYGGRINDCYSTGAVTGGHMVGGLVGENLLDGTISDCYSTGAVSGVNDTGGLVAWNEGIVAASYWDITLSNCATSAGGIGKSPGELKQRATFEGWDFAVTWDIQEAVKTPSLRKFNGTVPETYRYPVIQTSEFGHPWPGVAFSRLYEAYYADPAEPLTWSLSTTAGWLKINSTSGLISGTPVSDHTAHWATITVSDTLGRSNAIRFVVAVREGGYYPPMWTAVPGDTELVQGDDFRFNVSVVGANRTMTFGLSSEPKSGMSVNSSTGVLEWSGVATGNYTYNLTVSDGINSIWHVFNLTVLNSPLPEDRHPRIVTVSAPENMTVKASSVQTFSVEATSPTNATLTYEWKDNGVTVSTKKAFSRKFSPGDHVLILLIGDGRYTTTRTFNFTVAQPPKTIDTKPISLPGFEAGIVAAAVVVVVSLGLFWRRERR